MKSFRARLVLSFTTLTLVVSALLAAWVQQTGSDALRDDTDRLIRDRAYVLSKSVTPMAMRLQPWMEAFLETDKAGLLVQVTDPAGAVITRSANLKESLPLSSEARQAAGINMSAYTETITLPDGTALRLATVPVTTYRNGESVLLGFAQAALPDARRGERLHALRLGLVSGVAAATGVAWILAGLLARFWLR